MELKTREELAGKGVGIGLALIIVMELLLSGCAVNGAGLNSGRTEIPRQMKITKTQDEPFSSLLIVQPYRSTWAIVRVYKGNLSRNQAIGNTGGKLAFYGDYIHKLELTNAFASNMPNAGEGVANTAVLILESDKDYTIVYYVGQGRGWFERVYTVNTLCIHTGNDPIARSWTDARNRRWMANRVLILPGTDQPSSASWNFQYQVNATELVRNAIGSALAR